MSWQCLPIRGISEDFCLTGKDDPDSGQIPTQRGQGSPAIDGERSYWKLKMAWHVCKNSQLNIFGFGVPTKGEKDMSCNQTLISRRYFSILHNTTVIVGEPHCIGLSELSTHYMIVSQFYMYLGLVVLPCNSPSLGGEIMSGNRGRGAWNCDHKNGKVEDSSEVFHLFTNSLVSGRWNIFYCYNSIGYRAG